MIIKIKVLKKLTTTNSYDPEFVSSWSQFVDYYDMFS